MLARMHLAGASFALQQPHLRGLAWWLRDGAAGAAAPARAGAGRAAAATNSPSSSTWPASPAGQALPRGPIHADLFRDNVMFDDTAGADRLCGFFDFYFAGTDMLLFDVAVCLNDWCTDLASGRLDEARAAAFVAAYAARAPAHRRRGARAAGAAARRRAALLDLAPVGLAPAARAPRCCSPRTRRTSSACCASASPRPGTRLTARPAPDSPRMTLQLKTVSAARGPRWMADAFRAVRAPAAGVHDDVRACSCSRRCWSAWCRCSAAWCR